MVRGRTHRVAQQIGERAGVRRLDRGSAPVSSSSVGATSTSDTTASTSESATPHGSGDAGSGDDQRNPVGLLEGAEVVGVEPVGADVAAVVAHEHHDRVIQHPQPLELVQERPHLRVELADEGVVHRARLAPLALADGAEHLALAAVERRAAGEGVAKAGGQVDGVQVVGAVGVAVGDEGDVGAQRS